MLVLTRGVGDIIRIGDETKIVILNVSSKVVRIGIEAPRSQKVYREELFYRIQEEKSALESKSENEAVKEKDAVEKISNTRVRYKIKRPKP